VRLIHPRGRFDRWGLYFVLFTAAFNVATDRPDQFWNPLRNYCGPVVGLHGGATRWWSNLRSGGGGFEPRSGHGYVTGSRQVIHTIHSHGNQFWDYTLAANGLWLEIATRGFLIKDGSFQSTPTSVDRSLWIGSCCVRNCSRRVTVRLGIDTLIANILV